MESYIQEENIVYCDKCTTVFSDQKELEDHQNIRGRTLHTCQICLFASCSTNELHQHYQNSHSDRNYRGKKNILAGNVDDDLDNLFQNASTDDNGVDNGCWHQFQSTQIHTAGQKIKKSPGKKTCKII